MEDSTEKRVDEKWKETAKNETEGAPAEDQRIPEADFKFFLTTLGMQAWIALGLLPNPMTKKTEENIGQAKFIIDTLSVLQKKTQGNLDKEEGEILEQLLYELRMGYVDKTNKKEGGPHVG